MIKNIYPVISTGEAIDKETLELLRDNPMEITLLMNKRYHDGIIDGFEVSVTSDGKDIRIEKGLLKFSDKYFWSNEPFIVKIPEIEDRYIIKFRLDCEIKEKKRYIRTGNVIMEKGISLQEDEMEITRFIKREGAELRTAYSKYEALDREYNTLNLIYRKYSCLHTAGKLDPLILKFWGKEAFEKENLDSFDIFFASKALDYGVNRDNTIMYINRKLGERKEEYTNYEIYQSLLKILENLGMERKLREENIFRPRKIIVD